MLKTNYYPNIRHFTTRTHSTTYANVTHFSCYASWFWAVHSKVPFFNFKMPILLGRRQLKLICILPQYFCVECQIFDSVDKGQFHCKGCGLCRLGGRQNFFHCDTCEMCLPMGLQKSHCVRISLFISHNTSFSSLARQE